ncbi:uncharacterized protein BDZ99DRAFT_465953, partial [Mytilinidion resinicola]
MHWQLGEQEMSAPTPPSSRSILLLLVYLHLLAAVPQRRKHKAQHPGNIISRNRIRLITSTPIPGPRPAHAVTALSVALTAQDHDPACHHN